MKLPNCNSVYIPPSKLNEYLLSETHIIGKKYIIEGFLETPNKTIIKVRTIWVIETKESNPRFVTAYPINSANTEV